MIGDLKPHTTVSFMDLSVVAEILFQHRISDVDGFNVPCKLLWITHYFVAFHPAAKHPNIMVDRELRDRRNKGGGSIKNSDNLCSFQNHLEKSRFSLKSS
jgi:hypothetical protein